MEGLILLIAGYLFLTPLVLVVVVIIQRKRLNRIEAQLHRLLSQLDGKTPPASVPESNHEPLATPPEPSQAVPQPVEPRAEPVQSSPTPVKPPMQPAASRPIPVEPLARKLPPAAGKPELTAVEVGPSTGTKIRDFLRGVGMWPPESVAGKDREAILMQWWLPRVGGLLALLSALFFGVYINQSTSPFVRCVEMAGASLAVTALGRYLEGKFRTFGGVVLVTGMVMLYLTSVAAYVLPAVRVIENPLAGAIAQAVVLVIISVVGFMRRSEGIVLLAFHLGFLLGIFMAWEGLREGALIAAALLFLSGSLLARQKVFRHLVWVVVPGGFLVALAFPVLALWRTVEIPTGIPIQVYLNGLMAGVVILYLTDGYGERWRPKVLASTGSSLAILCTAWFFREFYSSSLDWAVFVLGCTMLAGAIAAWSLRGCGFLAQLLFIKASFLIAVWAVLYYAGDLRWMVLGLESLVVALSARRARVVALECAAWAVAVASVYYYLPVFAGSPVFGTLLWWLMAIYPGFLVTGLSLVLPAFNTSPVDFRNADRRIAYALVPFVATWLWFRLFASTQGGEVGAPAPFIAILYIMAGMALLPFAARWMFLLSAALAYVVATVLYCSEPFSLVLLILLLVATTGGLRWLVRRDNRGSIVGENALYVFGITPLVLWILQATGDWPGKVVLVMLLAIGITLLGLLPRLRHAGAWACLPLVIMYVSEGVRGAALAWELGSVAIGLGWLALPRLGARFRDGLGWAGRHSIWEFIGSVILFAYLVEFTSTHESWILWQGVLVAAAGVLLAGSWAWRTPGYFVGAVLLAALLMLRHFGSMLGEGRAYVPWVREALLSGAMVYGILLLWFFLKPKAGRIISGKGYQSALSALAAILFFLNAVVTFQYYPLDWMSVYTPILALNAFVMILLGLFRADPVFRRAGILALAVPLVRLFVIDVQDALYRIIAFAAAAAVLTLLGYLYHLLAARLVKPADE